MEMLHIAIGMVATFTQRIPIQTHTSNHVSACCRIQCSKFFTILCDALFLVEISLPILKWHQHWTFSFGRLFSINLIFCFVEICFINRTWQNFHILNSLQKSGTYSVESFSGDIVNTQKTDLFNANKPAKNMYSILFFFFHFAWNWVSSQ